MRSARGQKQGMLPKISWRRLIQPLCRVKYEFALCVDVAFDVLRGMIFDRGWKVLIRRQRVLVFTGFRQKSRPVSRISALRAAKSVYISSNGAPYARVPPKIVGAPEHLTRELWGKVTERLVVPPCAATIKLRGASVMAGGVVMTKNGKIVEETLINTQFWQKFGILERQGDGETLHINLPMISFRRRIGAGPCALIKQNWDSNYGHWLIEGLPRIALIAEHFDLQQLRFIVADGHGPAMEQVYKDSLAAFGIGAGQLIFIGWETVDVAELIYPLPMAAHPWTKSQRIVQILEDLAASYNFGTGGPKRIYLSRNKTPKRRLVNEDEILEIVEGIGFVSVHPESMAFREQVELFRNAECIIGSYGAALTNLVFAPRKVSVLALTSQFMQDDFIWDLTSLKDGYYASLHGRALQPDLGYHSDFEIDITEFKAMLGSVGIC